MSTSDSNYDELNNGNGFDEYSSDDAGYQNDAGIADESGYTDESTGQEYSDAGEYTDGSEYVDSTEYADGGEYADSTEYADGGEYADSSEYSGEYSGDAYAPLEGVDEYSDGYASDEPVEEERQEVYFPPVMNRYNVILLLSLLIILTGIVLVLIRLIVDYNFEIKAKTTDSGFASVERVLPASTADISVIKNV